MKKTPRSGHVNGFVLAIGVLLLSPLSYAGLPAGRDELRIYPGDPQKPGESVVSISGRWVTDEGLQTGFTALTFLNGPDLPKADNAQSVAKKVAKSVNRGLAYLRISLRGLSANLAKDPDKPHYVIKNKENMALTKITVRDYINDKYRTEISAKSFGQHGVKVSFDLAESASIAKAITNYSISERKSFRATGGGVAVTIGDGKPIRVDTKDKTTEDIEKALASKLGGSFSSSPLFPDEREKRDKKNIKPFDGGEVQIENMAANAFSVEVNDPSLGIINRYLFRESGSSGSGWW